MCNIVFFLTGPIWWWCTSSMRRTDRTKANELVFGGVCLAIGANEIYG